MFSRDVNNQIGGFCDTLFLHPTAPYWYLYALFFIFLVTPTFSTVKMTAVGLAVAIAAKAYILTGGVQKYMLYRLFLQMKSGFLNGFLIPDMKLLQEMGYEVHCAANGNSVSTFVPEERFASIGVTFHQIDFSSTSPISKESLTAYKQYKELLNRYHFDFVHVHTPIPGAIVRMATRRKRKGGCVVVYTTHRMWF